MKIALITASFICGIISFENHVCAMQDSEANRTEKSPTVSVSASAPSKNFIYGGYECSMGRCKGCEGHKGEGGTVNAAISIPPATATPLLLRLLGFVLSPFSYTK